MLQLELLWGLQCIDRDINGIKKEMRNKELSRRLSKIKEEYYAIKENVEAELQRLGEGNKKSARLNMDLKHLDSKVKECSRKLYEDGSSMKIVDSLQKEVEAYKTAVDETENELLEIMDKNENIKSSVEDKKTKLNALKREFEDLKSRYVKASEKNKKDLEDLNNKRDSIIKEIDEGLLKQYNDIAVKGINAVSQVKSEMCTECGVMLNAMLYDKLKRKSEICLCDHCGRILYIG